MRNKGNIRHITKVYHGKTNLSQVQKHIKLGAIWVLLNNRKLHNVKLPL